MTDIATETVTNPYMGVNEETPRKAWDHGRDRAKGDEAAFQKGTYLAIPNQDAWQEGFDSVPVETEPFDPTTVTIDKVNVNTEYGTWVTTDDEGKATNHFGFYLTWHRNFSEPADHASNIRPDWADFHVKDRVWFEIDSTLARSITYSNLRNHAQLNLHVDLPCPPYEYSTEGSQLTIKAGAYSKGGTKADFEAFIEELQGEVEDMPEGFDISDDTVEVAMSVTVRFTKSMQVNEIVDGDEQMGEDDMWMGTGDELISAIEGYFEYADSGDLVDSYDLQYANYDEAEVEDIDMSDVTMS